MRLFVACFCLTLLAGCGASDEPVRVSAKGEVHLDGQPLAKGSITFSPVAPAKGPMAAAEIIDGKYEIDEAEGPSVGTNLVRIYAEENVGFELDDPRQFSQQPNAVMPPNPMPARYNDTSKMKVEAKLDADNVFDFRDLTSAK